MTFDYSVLNETEKIIFALRSLYKDYGYEQYQMSKFEEYDLYSQNKDFLVSDSVITFTDTNGKLLALKPDVTLSIIKHNKNLPKQVQRICYNENIYRVSKCINRFKEIMQVGLECIGRIDNSCIGEVLFLAAKSLSMCSSCFVLEISHLGILSSFVDLVSEDAAVKQSILKCVGEKNLHGITEICIANGIEPKKAEPLHRLLSVYGAPKKVLPILSEVSIGMGIEKEVGDLRDAVGVFVGTELSDRVQIDFSVVSDINYYDNIVFKGFIQGIPGSVLSGGRYDRLMVKMGKSSKALGFAVYLDMLERLPAQINEVD